MLLHVLVLLWEVPLGTLVSSSDPMTCCRVISKHSVVCVCVCDVLAPCPGYQSPLKDLRFPMTLYKINATDSGWMFKWNETLDNDSIGKLSSIYIFFIA